MMLGTLLRMHADNKSGPSVDSATHSSISRAFADESTLRHGLAATTEGHSNYNSMAC